jgi:hypothetical protein
MSGGEFERALEEHFKDDEHALGLLQGRVEALQSDVSVLKADMRKVVTAISEARGGWKTIVLASSIAGAAGAALSTFATWFRGGS